MLLSVFFLGCGGKSGIYTNAQKEQAIVSTQKTRIAIDDNSTIFLMATYLNNMQKYSANETEMIILSYYHSLSLPDIKSDLSKPAVKLNNKNVEVIELENSDELLKDIPFNNAWNKHYLLLSKQENSNILKLVIEIYPFPSALLELTKEL
jgi:hypothetical protein